ncbi:MAG: polysaccharide deacetylase family protein [Gemmatimonadota bacterium]|nr:MAG: polysaccharide deacetylase family protein [Gemmatimonadota bacterium]
MSVIGKAVGSVISLPSVGALFTPLVHDRGVILRLHRFRDAELGIDGRDPQALRRVLEFLRRERYELLTLVEMIHRLAGDGRPLRRAVAVTIDDGYFDQATVGAPLFAEFDCPVTTFVTTGFLDQKMWFWWDKITYVFDHTPRRDLRLIIGDSELRYYWEDIQHRNRAREDFKERCKAVRDADKDAAIQSLAASAEVELPDRAPPKYSPMSWDQLRACEEGVMTFAPHTVNHPVLSQASAEQARREIEDSWRRLCDEAYRPIPIMAYPNGRLQDFGRREIDVLKSLGFMGAVATETGYNDSSWFRANPDARYMLRRFGNADSLPHVAQFVSGFQRVKDVVRGEKSQLVRTGELSLSGSRSETRPHRYLDSVPRRNGSETPA